MSYQALSAHEDVNSLSAVPSQHGSTKGATTPGNPSMPQYSRAVNYIHISDVGDITGTVYHIDTDLPPAYGRFDNQEEQDEAPNVFLSADTIQAEIRLSGSKKAKIDIKGHAGQGYGRIMLRIVDARKPSIDGADSTATHFALNLSATSKSTILVSLPSTFSGSVTGACSLNGHLRDEAVCLVADAKKSRWTVRQEHDLYPTGPMSSSSSQYPPVSGDDLLDSASRIVNEQQHSSVTFNLLETAGWQDSAGKRQRARRHVVYEDDYKIGLDRLSGAEAESRASVRKALLIYLLSCLAWCIFILWAGKQLDAPTEGYVALMLFPIGVSLIFPAIVVGESFSEYFYKAPQAISA